MIVPRIAIGLMVLSTLAEARRPYAQEITGMTWGPRETIVRAACGIDNWPLTWADDDTLIGAYGDEIGFARFHATKLSLGLARISGGPTTFRGSNLRAPVVAMCSLIPAAVTGPGSPMMPPCVAISGARSFPRVKTRADHDVKADSASTTPPSAGAPGRPPISPTTGTSAPATPARSRRSG